MMYTTEDIRDYIFHNMTSEEVCELVSSADLFTLWGCLKRLIVEDYGEHIESLIRDFRIKNGYDEFEEIDFKRIQHE